jgi:pyruvate kinase
MYEIHVDHQPEELKRTKIVATISDRNCEPEFIRELYENGMNVVRFNTAHQELSETLGAIEKVRKASKNIAIMIDTKGPEVRTTKAIEGFSILTGDIVKFVGNPDGVCEDGVVCVNYVDFVKESSVGNRILIDDGILQFTVTQKDGDALICRADNDGSIQSRKSINTPDVSLNVPALSDKDIDYIHFAADNKIDFIAHSFVRRKEDLITIQDILDEKKSGCKIISKIESQEGVDKIEEILDHSYGIMVARGDLAVEIAREKIPVIQKQLVQLCKDRRKPVIIATQMLHSMMDNPTPTRAEVSDIANAVFDTADAIMLSGETAYGRYPVESLKVMNSVCLEVEKSAATNLDAEVHILKSAIPAYLCRSAARTAASLGAQGIIADTHSGRTCRNISGFRGKEPIFAFCYKERTMRELALSYGVTPYFVSKPRKNTDDVIDVAVAALTDKGVFTDKDLLVIIAGSYGRSVGASFIKVSTVENLKKASEE